MCRVLSCVVSNTLTPFMQDGSRNTPCHNLHSQTPNAIPLLPHPVKCNAHDIILRQILRQETRGPVASGLLPLLVQPRTENNRLVGGNSGSPGLAVSWNAYYTSMDQRVGMDLCSVYSRHSLDPPPFRRRTFGGTCSRSGRGRLVFVGVRSVRVVGTSVGYVRCSPVCTSLVGKRGSLGRHTSSGIPSKSKSAMPASICSMPQTPLRAFSSSFNPLSWYSSDWL